MTTIPEAVDALREGQLVAFPTETVYGLGADARNATAVQSIFKAKGRPGTRALICHVADADMARQQVVAHWPAYAETLASKYWPGPLTLILLRRETIPDAVTGGGETVGVRAPDHPMAQDFIRAFGGPVAAPSANRFGAPPPINASQVTAAFGTHKNIRILDGGTTPGGLESTVLDLSTDPPVLRRAGAIPIDELEALLGAKIEDGTQDRETDDSDALPAAIRFESAQWSEIESDLTKSDVVLSFGVEWDEAGLIVLPPSDEGYARGFFEALHDARERTASAVPPGRVFIEWPDETRYAGGLWPSIRARIERYSRPVE